MVSVQLMVKVVTCIPAYNEEKTIARVVIEAQKHSDIVIVCDDGSTDYTGVIAEKLGAIVVKHEKNMGYGAALRSLFKKALEYYPEIVITIDADLQHNPKYIPVLVKALEEEKADIVIASRVKGDETPKYRRLAVKTFSKIMGAKISDVQSGFRAYKASILKNIIPDVNGMEASIEILNKALERNYKIVEVPVPFKYKGLETSTLNPLVHGYNIISEILKSRIIRKPLTYLGIPGLVFIVTGLMSGLWVIKRYAEVRQLATGTAIITAILLISGLLLILTAIHIFTIKEYAKLSRVR